MGFNPSSTGATLGLNGSTSGQISQFASASTITYSIFWPSTQAASAGYVLSNDGAGNLSWVLNGAGGGVTSVTGSGAISSSGGTTPNITLNSNSVTNTFLAQMVANTIKGNNTGSTANTLDLTVTQVTAMLNLFSSSLQGLTPASGGGTVNFLRADGTWTTPSSSGVQRVDKFTLNGTNITNKFVTLSLTPSTAANTILIVEDAGGMFYGIDFTVTSSQLGWSGLGLDGIFSSGDNLTVTYSA